MFDALERPIGKKAVEPELVASIVRRYQSGQSIQMLAFGCGLGRERIRKILIDAGAPIRRAVEMKRYNQRFIARKKSS